MENLITLCLRWPEMPEYCASDYMEWAIVEYLSAWYAENEGDTWYPFK